MWRNMTLWLTIVSVVVLGLPMVGLAEPVGGNRSSQVIPYTGPGTGRPAVSDVAQKAGVEMGLEEQKGQIVDKGPIPPKQVPRNGGILPNRRNFVNVRNILNRPAPNAPNLRVEPPAAAPVAQPAAAVQAQNQAGGQQTGQVRAEVQRGTIGTGIVNGPDDSRSVATQAPNVIGQDAVSYRNYLAKEDDYVLASVDAVRNQINQVQQTLDWLTSLNDPHTWDVFMRNASSPKELRDASGRPVGLISWTTAVISDPMTGGSRRVVTGITYSPSITTRFRFAQASMSGAMRYSYDFGVSRDRFGMMRIGMHRTVDGGGSLLISKADGTTTYKQISHYQPRRPAF